MSSCKANRERGPGSIPGQDMHSFLCNERTHQADTLGRAFEVVGAVRLGMRRLKDSHERLFEV